MSRLRSSATGTTVPVGEATRVTGDGFKGGLREMGVLGFLLLWGL